MSKTETQELKVFLKKELDNTAREMMSQAKVVSEKEHSNIYFGLKEDNKNLKISIDILAESFNSHKEEMRPILNAYNSANTVGSFFVWLSKIIIAVGIIAGALWAALTIRFL